jgi:hypothetical protein
MSLCGQPNTHLVMHPSGYGFTGCKKHVEWVAAEFYQGIPVIELKESVGTCDYNERKRNK